MTYRSPGPSVTENFLTSTTDFVEPALLPCLVGSLNQVIKKSPLVFPVLPATIIFPKLKPGAIVQTQTVNINVDNAMISILTGSGGTAAFNSNQYVSPTAIFADVKIGDSVAFLDTDSKNAGKFTVSGISADNKTLTFTSEFFMALDATYTFTVTRNVGNIIADMEAPSFTSISVTFTGLQYQLFNIIAGSVSISYVALRKDLTGFYKVSSPSQLLLDMDVDPLNPLGFYLGNIMLGASGGANSLAYITPDNSQNSYLVAFEYLATRKDIYIVTELTNGFNETQVGAVNADLIAHINAMSTPNPGPSFYRSGFVPATTVDNFKSKVLEVGVTTNLAQCS